MKEALQSLGSLRPWTPARRCTRRVNAEALVPLRGIHYSVPARYCGHRVELEAKAGTITIRSGDLIIAEHPQSLGTTNARVELPEHVQERWELSGANGSRKLIAPKPLCEIRLDAVVQERPLALYEQEAA